MVETFMRIAFPGMICAITLYITLSLYLFYNIYVTPLIVFEGITREEHVRKSEREWAYNSRLVATLLINMLIVPFIYSMVLNATHPKLFKEKG